MRASDPEALKEQHRSGSLKVELSIRYSFNHAHKLFLDVSLDVTQSTRDPPANAKLKIFNGMLKCWEQPCLLRVGVQVFSELSSSLKRCGI